MDLIFTIMAVFLVLCISEYGWRKHWLANEFGRKFVHITVGSFVAFWPFFLSWDEIRLLSLAFLIVVTAAHQLRVFHAIDSIQRPTYGEYFFAIAVGLLTFVTTSKGVYAAAILQMSLADGMAALIGTRYGRDNMYHVLGQRKSVAGTLAFIIVSVLLLVGYSHWGPGGVSVLAIAGIAGGSAFVENVGILGLDNILVPVFVALALTFI